ncbi:MAG: antibiotic biosynthesis monooxygenase [Candidatus Hinthialibacter antarcticus]|nr:antibiotic biosynthesis monooxygenase [Candidatus Hinthialibacter antarcticus]
MYVVCVTVYVVPGKENEFIEATSLNHKGTRQEPGNLRFDVLQANDDPARFFLYEAYRSEDDFKAHQQTNHYLTWRETVQDWMAKKREGVKHTSLFPTDGDW